MMPSTYIDGMGLRRCRASGKVCFASRAEAESTRYEGGRDRWLYRCRCCAEIHWGSAPKPEGVKPARRRKAR